MTSSWSETYAVTLLDVSDVPLVVTQQYSGETIPLTKGQAWQVLLVAAPGAHPSAAYLLISIQQPGSSSDNFEVVVHSDHTVQLERAPHATSFRVESNEVPDAFVVLALPVSAQGRETAESLMDVFEQYCGLTVVKGSEAANRGAVPPPPGSRAQQQQHADIELEDENGNVLATLDPASTPVAPSSSSPSASPTAQQREKDWLMNGAHGIARGMNTFSGWAGGHMTRAADRYTSRGDAGFNSGAASPSRQGYAGSPSLGVPGKAKTMGDVSPSSGYGDEKRGYTGYAGSSSGVDYSTDQHEDASTWRRSPSPLQYTSAGTSNDGRSSPRRSNVKVHPSVTRGLTALQTGSGHVVRLSGQARTAILNASEGAGRKLGGVSSSMRPGEKEKWQAQEREKWEKRQYGQGYTGSPTGSPSLQPATNAGPPSGTSTPTKKPGAFRTQLARGAQAANVLIDGFDSALSNLVDSAGSSASQAIEFRFGPEARAASGLAGNVGRNVFLVYKDVSGIRRKCLLKVAGGSLQGTTPEGNKVVVTMPPEQQGTAAGVSGGVMTGRTGGTMDGNGGGHTDVDSIEHDYHPAAAASSSGGVGGGGGLPRYEDVKRG